MEYTQIAALLNQLPFDIRAEVVAADLLAQGFDPEHLIIEPRSLFKRRFAKDVLQVIPTEAKNGEVDLRIQISRDGLYDALPEGLFHQPKNKKFFRTTDEMVMDVRRQRQEEEEARRFFLPMENELYHLRTAIELAERKLFFELEQNEQNDFLISFWNLEKYRAYKTLPVLIRFLPLMHRLAGHLSLAQICYELLLRVPVKITAIPTFQPLATEQFGWQLGNDVLGFQTTLGTHAPAQLCTIEITLGPLTTDQLSAFLPGGDHLPYLDLLHSYFLPAGFETQLRLYTFPQENTTTLGGDIPLHLGMNMLLGV